MSYEFLIPFSADGQCTTHDARHLFRLVSSTGTADGPHPLVALLAVGGQNLGYPVGVVVRYLAKVARHREDEVVPATVLGLSPHLLLEGLYD